MSDFPTIVYKTPGDHFGPDGSTYNYAGAIDEVELGALLNNGWFRTLPEAIAKSHDEPVSEAPPTRAELEEKAVELGVKFDGRTSDATLLKRIEDALREESEP